MWSSDGAALWAMTLVYRVGGYPSKERKLCDRKEYESGKNHYDCIISVILLGYG